MIRHFGIVGEANIQYALDPYSKRSPSQVFLFKFGFQTVRRSGWEKNSSLASLSTGCSFSSCFGGKFPFWEGNLGFVAGYRIVEVNARLSRSSALASKARVNDSMGT